MTDAGNQAAGTPEPGGGDDTGAFQRFYQSPEPPPRGPLYRLLIGWWKDRPASR